VTKERIPRIDNNEELKKIILPYCRLKAGETWRDSVVGHKVGCLDAGNENDISKIMNGNRAVLAIQDPPYNVIVGNSNTENLSKVSLGTYIKWSKRWVNNTINILEDNAHLYIWLGADQNEGFQPLPDFMVMMRGFKELNSKSFITMRNQRGYGTQKNWMAVRQELLYYNKGKPEFNIEAEYTDIPKILRGYYKEINGKVTENFGRSKSENIRAGNVWVDVQQVFYRMEENVPGCYAQKPLKAIERIVSASTKKGDLIVDFFAHSGTSLISAEKLKRRCFTIDIDPIFAEITIRRLERFRNKGEAGWQFKNPFPEVDIKWEIENKQHDTRIIHGTPTQKTLFDELWGTKSEEIAWKD
jgi:site-specific DNA-methyltransferase (adenine-specific)